MSNFFKILLILVVFLSACGKEETNVTPNIPVEMEEEMENEMENTAEEMRDISSAELVAEMGVGWNLGNSFDVRNEDKTVWGNPLPLSTHINAVKDMGFSTLRIPITWNFNMLEQAPYTVDVSYLARIQRIVDAGLSNDMHVIINTHHDDWIIPTEAEATKVSERLASLWTQIGNHFIDYGDKLIFEVMNEPRLRDSPEEWSGGTAEGRATLNGFHQTCVEAIRATGQNNAKRHIMVSTYAASTTPNALRDLVVPNDPNIIISIHSYFPWIFAGQDAGGTNNWGSEADKMALDQELDLIRARWITQENRPVILGEWGSKDKNNLSARVGYADYYARGAVARGMVPIIWDDGGDFGLYDRHAMSWRYPEIAEAVVEAGQ